jgi:anaerobic selenocysteine-containing dehydrogenase
LRIFIKYQNKGKDIDKKMLLSMAVVAAVGVVMSGAPATARSSVAQRVAVIQIHTCNSNCSGGCGGKCNDLVGKANLKQEKPLVPSGICEKL